jgi:hypothetical protein
MFPVSQNNFVERRGIALLRAADQVEVNQHAAPEEAPASGSQIPASEL